MIPVKKIAIIGLGYVGLPLAVEFGQKYKTVGYDLNKKRIQTLQKGFDDTLEIDSEYLTKTLKNKFFKVTSRKQDIKSCNIFIITVPTPIDKHNRPVLSPLLAVSELVGSMLKKGDIVIYESTVYPGVTEDECVPVLEKVSCLIYNLDFFVGYSPERINPGDKEHTLTKILKVTSGSNKKVAEVIDKLYKSIIVAGTYKAASIKVAEAAKVIENSQRDINIAFVNELAKIFNLLGLNTNQVLEAAATKWNFLNFKPGLVGGHCIGVDPYYLAQKAQEVDHHPEIILSGRRVNDSMGKYVASETVKLMLKKQVELRNSNVLILGFTFKEECPDFRNTKVIDIIQELFSYGLNITTVDPWVDKKKVFDEYGINIFKDIPKKIKFDAAILAVGHSCFRKINFNSNNMTKNRVIYDVKGFLDSEITDGGL